MTHDPAQTPAEELALVRAFLTGSEEAINEVIHKLRCVPRILAAQNAKMGRPLDDHDLADLTQDTVVVILGKLDRFAGIAAFEGWVYRVCCLEFMNGLRRKRRSPQVIEDPVVVDDRMERQAEVMNEREVIHLAVDRVGGVEADAIRLKHFEDLTFDEIGRRLELSPNTVKARYYRGLGRLEEILATLEEG